MSSKCKECSEEFSSEKSLKAHLKKHGMKAADYYAKHFPRFDLYTHAPIVFKSTTQYFDTDFNNIANFKKWCKRENPQEVKEYLVKKMRAKIENKSVNYVLGQAQLASYGWPHVEWISDLFGSYEAFAQEVGHPRWFSSDMPKEFYKDWTELEVWIDTREKMPLNFINPTKAVKLDCGDYTLGGNDFSHTFVDRKSASDFIGTMSRDVDRFKREIERCCSIGGYLFVVVDATMIGVARELQFSKSQTNIHYIWHNMREILYEYAGDCQFVFSGGRTNSAILVPKLLKCGKSVWKTDVQYYIEQYKDWLE